MRTDAEEFDEDDWRYEVEPWCRDFDNHKAAHEFCIDHQAAWCRLCDKGICPQCVDDPHCRYCHVAIFEEYHNWDCPYADDDGCTTNDGGADGR